MTLVLAQVDIGLAERLRRRHEQINESRSAALIASIRSAFKQDRVAILSFITDVKRKSIERKSGIMWDYFLQRASDYLSHNAESWYANLFVTWYSLGLLHWEEWIDTNDLEPEPAGYAAWESVLRENISRINETTAEQMAQMVVFAELYGWGIEQMQERMIELFNQWEFGEQPDQPDDETVLDWYTPGAPLYRAEIINGVLQTQAAGIASQLYTQQARFALKVWASVMDGRERPAHHAAHMQTVPVQMPFIVGGEYLQYPGDPRGSMWNIANCRCVSIPVWAAE